MSAPLPPAFSGTWWPQPILNLRAVGTQPVGATMGP